MKKLILGVASLTAIAITVVIFYACNKEQFSKEGTVKSHVLTSFYDQNLLNQFMNEPLAQAFQHDLRQYDVTVLNGILKFKDLETFNHVYDLLIQYSELYDDYLVNDPAYAVYGDSEEFPDMPILYAFEVYKTDFYSLRSKIELKILNLEARDGIPKGGDPDDDTFVVSDYERTLLSPDCEIIIGTAIFLYGEEQSLMIPDLDFQNLKAVKSLWEQYGETEGTVKAFQQKLAYQNDLYKDGKDEKGCPDCNTLEINPQLKDGSSCPRAYSFYAKYNGSILAEVYINPNPTNCDVRSIHWDFGDHTTSSSYGPAHTYAQAGFYLVRCDIVLANGQTCYSERGIDVRNCAVDISEPTKDAAYEGDDGAKYIITATTKHCSGLTPIQYTWTVSGVNGGTFTTPTARLEHLFSFDADYMITVTADFSDGCSSSQRRKETIKGTGNCCKIFSGDRKIEYSPNSDFKIKHKFATRNFWPFHRIVVKSVHYKKKKNNNNYKRDKAARLYVNFYGEIARKDFDNNLSLNNSCGNQKYISSNGKTNHKKKSLTYDYGAGPEAFRVAKERLHSQYSAQSTNNGAPFYNNDALQLHNKPCRP